MKAFLAVNLNDTLAFVQTDTDRIYPYAEAPMPLPIGDNKFEAVTFWLVGADPDELNAIGAFMRIMMTHMAIFSQPHALLAHPMDKQSNGRDVVYFNYRTRESVRILVADDDVPETAQKYYDVAWAAKANS